ncbi:MAG TPA: hypothetical protein VK966_06860 [Longimicrobiales bacterium]|nr:hypothetical protein [Longimicrobiales bacterium]
MSDDPADSPSDSPSSGGPSGQSEARLWGGRFASGPAPELDRLNRSLPLTGGCGGRTSPGAARGSARSGAPTC